MFIEQSAYKWFNVKNVAVLSCDISPQVER